MKTELYDLVRVNSFEGWYAGEDARLLAAMDRPLMRGATAIRIMGWATLAGLGLMLLGAAALAIGLAGAGTLNRMAAESLASLLVGLALGSLGGLIFLVGLVGYVLIPAFQWELAKRDYGSHRTILASLALAVVVSNLVSVPYFLIQGMPDASLRPRDLLFGITALELVLGLIVYLRVVRPGVITWAQMGLTTEHLGRRVLIGLASGLGLFLLAAVTGLLMSRLGIEQTQSQQFASIQGAPPLQFGLMLLLGGLLTGFCEESFFRGFAFQAYADSKGLGQAYLFSSFLFASVHLDWRAFVPILVLGFSLAFIYRRSGSLIPSALAHAVNNMLSFCILYFGPPLGG